MIVALERLQSTRRETHLSFALVKGGNRGVRRYATVGLALTVLLAAAPVSGQMPPDWCDMEAPASGAPCAYGACDDAVTRDGWIPGPSTETLEIRVQFIVFADDDGSNQAASDEEVAAQQLRLNEDFLDYGIQFQYADTIVIQHTRFRKYCVDLDPEEVCRYGELCRADCVDDGNGGEVCSEEGDMKNTYAVTPDQQINIYVVGAGAAGGGIAYFPWCPDATNNMGGVVIHERTFSETLCGGGPCPVLTHELGHVLGLWHASAGAKLWPGCLNSCFEDPACDCTDPLCNDVGDLCCDTPPTQGNRFCVDPTSTLCGEVYVNTDATNYMDFGAFQGCSDHFTNQQSGRMHCWVCDVAGGWVVGPDCNGNGTADVCDLRSGTSTDCDGSGIPDDCEYPVGGCCTPGACSIEADLCCTQQGGTFIGGLDACDEDCNNNGVADECDIASSPSSDCYNSNGIPDECEAIPRGACCFFFVYTCVDLTECACHKQRGTYLGDGSSCSFCENFGPQPGP